MNAAKKTIKKPRLSDAALFTARKCVGRELKDSEEHKQICQVNGMPEMEKFWQEQIEAERAALAELDAIHDARVYAARSAA